MVKVQTGNRLFTFFQAKITSVKDSLQKKKKKKVSWDLFKLLEQAKKLFFKKNIFQKKIEIAFNFLTSKTMSVLSSVHLIAKACVWTFLQQHRCPSLEWPIVQLLWETRLRNIWQKQSRVHVIHTFLKYLRYSVPRLITKKMFTWVPLIKPPKDTLLLNPWCWQGSHN